MGVSRSSCHDVASEMISTCVSVNDGAKSARPVVSRETNKPAPRKSVSTEEEISNIHFCNVNKHRGKKKQCTLDVGLASRYVAELIGWLCYSNPALSGAGNDAVLCVDIKHAQQHG